MECCRKAVVEKSDTGVAVRAIGGGGDSNSGSSEEDKRYKVYYRDGKLSSFQLRAALLHHPANGRLARMIYKSISKIIIIPLKILSLP